MDISIKEEKDNLICLQHNKKIKMLIMDDQVPFNQALICSKCLQDKPTISHKIIAITQAQKMIAEKTQIENIGCLKQTVFKELSQLSNHIIDYKDKLIQRTDIIIGVLQQWMEELVDERNILPTSLIQELQKLQSNIGVKKSHKHQIEKINKAYFIKLLTSFKKLLDDKEIVSCKLQIDLLHDKIQTNNKIRMVDEGIEIMKNIELSQYELLKEANVPKKFDLINKVKQSDGSYAIAFNKAGSLMVAGCQEDIKVWEFQNGKLQQLQTLSGHAYYVRCLVFSKKLNWFVSSSYKMIICWKEQENDWISCQPQNQKHTSFITCLLLSQNEKELISCGDDKLIIVWNVNCQTNKIKYRYTLENKHTEGVSCISKNLNETALVSCSNDKTIILWMRAQNKKWIYVNHIQISEGYRIYFISENQILFQPSERNQTLILQIENKTLIEMENHTIILKDANQDENLFPTIYNKNREIIIQKHNKYVYIIQKQIDGTFKIVLEPIDCQHIRNYGQLTENGDYLVTWNCATQEFRIYEIQY